MLNKLFIDQGELRVRYFKNFSFNNFWDDCEYAKKEYISEPPTNDVIKKIEGELGYKLPKSYIWLMKNHNGGTPINNCFPINTPTSWAADHIAITGIYGIGYVKSSSLGGHSVVDFGLKNGSIQI
jgi:hypothetical protein